MELVDRLCRNPVEGDNAFNEQVRNCTTVLKGHLNATGRILECMWTAIICHDSLAFLADVIDDPELPNTQEQCFLCTYTA